MKKKKTLIPLLITFIAFFTVLSLLPSPSGAAISATGYDFGEVEVGASKTTFVRLTNPGSTLITLTGLVFGKTDCNNFSIISLPESMTIPPDETQNVEIGYSPSTIGNCSDTLKIYSGSPFPSQVTFTGSGIEPASTKNEPDDTAQPFLAQMENIIAFMNTCIGDGSVNGSGAGNSAESRLKAFKTTLVVTSHLIDNGNLEAAYNKLKEIYKKIDGKPKPKDFVSGDNAPQLASMIQELIVNIGS
jgi:hypothetical protein